MCADEKRPNALPEFTRWLAGSERPRPASHKHLGPLHPEEAVAFTLVARRKPGSPPLPDLERRRKTAFGNRSQISTEEYIQTYGADPAELEVAAAFVREMGMTVLAAHAGRRTLSVLGIAAQVNAVFGVELQRYVDPRAPEIPQCTPSGSESAGAGSVRSVQELRRESHWGSHRGFDGAVYLPPELAEIVVAVVGLDDRFLGAPRGAVAGELDRTSYPPVSAVVQKHNFPNTGAYGETIGILAAQAPGFPGTPPCYLLSDINHLYFANLPAGYRTRPASIVDINLKVGTTTYRNNPSQVTKITNLVGANNAILELTQDISTSTTVAQGARVNVYFTEASEQGYLTFLNRVLLPERERQPSVLSLSLGMYEGEGADGASVPAGARAVSGSSSLAYLIDELFRQIAALGISVFIAVGDCGADKWRLLAAPNLVPAAAAPQLRAAMHGSAAISSTFAAAFSAVSLHIAVGATGMNDAAGVTHSGRGIPDICGDAAYSGFFVNGISYSYMGTSCAASFYAGMTAMLRSAFGAGLGFLNSMLFELRKTKFKGSPSGDNDSRSVSGSAAKGSSEPKRKAPDTSLFTAGAGTVRDDIDSTQDLKGMAWLRTILSY